MSASDPTGSGAARVAARILLLDDSSRLLLFEARDLSDPTDTERFWFTAGGGIDPGESLEEAAEREVAEETGQTGLTLAGPFYRREFTFRDHGAPQRQVEHFFAARTASIELDARGWTDLERRTVTRWHWWTSSDLAATGVRYFPENLLELLRRAQTLV